MTRPTDALPPALTVHQPHAHALVTGIKRIENRSWHTDYRGPLLIHAAKALVTLREFGPFDDPSNPPQFEDGTPLPPPEEMKATLGSIVGVVHLDRTEDFNPRKHRRLSFACGPVLWHVSQARAFTRPIPCTGQLGLWRVPEVLATAVRTQLEGVQAHCLGVSQGHPGPLGGLSGARESLQAPGKPWEGLGGLEILPGPQQAPTGRGGRGRISSPIRRDTR
jgi:hypothetical protein